MSPAPDFYTLFRGLLLALPALWNAVLMGPDPQLDAIVIGGTWRMLPYLIIAALARWIGSKPILVLTGVVLVGSDLWTFLSVMHSRSSTAPVALMIQPFLALVVVAGASALAWLIKLAEPSGSDSTR